MYRVIHYFTDLQDEDHIYHAGDTFPREGLKVTKTRINGLLSGKNARDIPLIEEVLDVPINTKKKGKKNAK